MAAAVIQEPEAPEVAELTDDTCRELVALREGGMTLAELKARFPQLTGEQIREVLPPANARERKQRTTRAKPKTVQEAAKNAKPVGGKTSETRQGIGGRSGEAKTQPKAQEQKAEEPKPAPAPRYVDKAEAGPLSDRVLAARKALGRKVLAEALGISESACWRAEQGHIHPAEVQALTEGVGKVEGRIESGEFKQEARQPKAAAPKKSELTHRIEVVVELLKSARGDKSITKPALIDSVLAVLDPTDAPKA